MEALLCFIWSKGLFFGHFRCFNSVWNVADITRGFIHMYRYVCYLCTLGSESLIKDAVYYVGPIETYIKERAIHRPQITSSSADHMICLQNI
jgi:hypothetical protein